MGLKNVKYSQIPKPEANGSLDIFAAKMPKLLTFLNKIEEIIKAAPKKILKCFVGQRS